MSSFPVNVNILQSSRDDKQNQSVSLKGHGIFASGVILFVISMNDIHSLQFYYVPFGLFDTSGKLI